jgi:hypothetical protein
MKFTDCELVDINARAVQQILDLAELDECRTLDDFLAARERIRRQAVRNAQVTKNALQSADD